MSDEAEVIGKTCSAVLRSELCANGCPLAASPTAGRGGHQRTVLEVGGRRIHVTEGLSPMVDDEGRSLGHLVILTELPEESGNQEREGFFGLIGRSTAMRAVFERIQQLAQSEVTVLITGESGTGKELAARAVHQTSPRSAGPFLAVNCAALPEGLLESEIFGHVKGSFTGAVRDRLGRVELARGGTLFLDEIGELPLALQAKLLRLVQERTFERVGEDQTRSADIRIVAATNRDLAQEVAQGTFREDLYYRLRVVPLRMPPLRERGHDVMLLARRLLEHHGRLAGREGMFFTRPALELLLRYSWPGNVRELVNAIEYVVALTPNEAVSPADLPPEITQAPRGSAEPPSAPAPASVAHASSEEEQVRAALERHQWHRLRAAEELGINRVTLYRLMRRYGITGPRGARRGKLAPLP